MRIIHAKRPPPGSKHLHAPQVIQRALDNLIRQLIILDLKVRLFPITHSKRIFLNVEVYFGLLLEAGLYEGVQVQVDV